jgi:hypothetical protein
MMIYGPQRVEFDHVEVIRDAGLVLMCRVGTQGSGPKVGGVPQRSVLPGTTIFGAGDRGRLVLSREVALNLGLPLL